MKRSVQTFSVAFVVFLAVGLYQAWEQRRHEDKYDFLLTLTAEYIDRHLERPLLHPPAFSYRCNSQQLFRYNIDAASFLELNVNPLPAAGPLKSSLSNVEIASLMTGLHAPEIIRMVKSGESLSSREIMAGVLGAISGYSFGKWIGTRSRPPCDSEQILRQVQDVPQFSRDLGKELVKRELNRYFVVEVGNHSALVSRPNLISIRIAAEVLEKGTVPIFEDRVIISPAGQPSRDEVDYVCDRLADLQVRMQVDSYRAGLRDFKIAQDSFVLFYWLNRNPQLTQRAFPNLYITR